MLAAPSSPCTPPPSPPAPSPPILTTLEAARLVALSKSSLNRLPYRAALLSSLNNHNPSYLPSRHILTTWLLEAAAALYLAPTTLHAAVALTDTFLARRPCPQSAWQLAAAAALLIAAKTQESLDNVPLLSEIHAVTGGAYSSSALKDMEIIILETLHWDVLVHTAVHFLTNSLETLERLQPPSNSRKRPFPSLADLAFRPRKAARHSPVGSPISSPSTPSPSPPPSPPSSPLPSLPALSPTLSPALAAVARAAHALLDQALYDTALCGTHSPQHIAAAALRVGRRAAGHPGWPPHYSAATGLEEDEFASENDALMRVFQVGA